MKAYLIASIALHALGVLLYGYYLLDDKYPRKKEAGRGSDCFGMILALGWIFWSGLLLYFMAV